METVRLDLLRPPAAVGPSHAWLHILDDEDPNYDYTRPPTREALSPPGAARHIDDHVTQLHAGAACRNDV